MPSTQPSVINPTPKARFQESADNVTKHRNLVDLPEFQRAADFALMEYQTLLAKSISDGNSAMAAGIKVQGALEFLTQFRLLSETALMPARPVVETLNHRV